MMKLPPALLRQAARIDALTLRERAILFVSIAIALVAAADHLVLSPRMAEQKTLATQMRQQSRELGDLRAQAAAARADTPATRIARELEATRNTQRTLDEAMARLQSGLSGGPGAGTSLPDLLERVLRRHERLTLLRLATVKPGAGAPPEPAPRAVQIAMRGSYPDLAQYVADTEAALPGLRWGEVAVLRQGSGAELSAQVFVVKASP